MDGECIGPLTAHGNLVDCLLPLDDVAQEDPAGDEFEQLTVRPQEDAPQNGLGGVAEKLNGGDGPRARTGHHCRDGSHGLRQFALFLDVFRVNQDDASDHQIRDVVVHEGAIVLNRSRRPNP